MARRLFLLALCLLGAAAFVGSASRPETRPARLPLANLPMTIGPWQGHEAAPLDRETLAVLGADDYVNRWYQAQGGAATLFIAYYASQRQGDAIHSPMNCLPGSGWQPIERGREQIAVAGRVLDVNRYVVQQGTERQVVLYWYQGRGRTVASEYWSKAYLILDAALRHRSDGALVRVTAPVVTSEQAAGETAARFVRALFPFLGEHLPS